MGRLVGCHARERSSRLSPGCTVVHSTTVCPGELQQRIAFCVQMRGLSVLKLVYNIPFCWEQTRGVSQHWVNYRRASAPIFVRQSSVTASMHFFPCTSVQQVHVPAGDCVSWWDCFLEHNVLGAKSNYYKGGNSIRKAKAPCSACSLIHN